MGCTGSRPKPSPRGLSRVPQLGRASMTGPWQRGRFTPCRALRATADASRRDSLSGAAHRVLGHTVDKLPMFRPAFTSFCHCALTVRLTSISPHRALTRGTREAAASGQRLVESAVRQPLSAWNSPDARSCAAWLENGTRPLQISETLCRGGQPCSLMPAVVAVPSGTAAPCSGASRAGHS